VCSPESDGYVSFGYLPGVQSDYTVVCPPMRSMTPNSLRLFDFGSFNTPLLLLPEAHDPSPCVPLDLTVQIHFKFRVSGVSISTEIFEVIFPEASDLLTRNPLATNGQDLLRLFAISPPMCTQRLKLVHFAQI
jgi:hypothetical protein